MIEMNRQQRRMIQREWNKIGLGSVCTKFVERNGLFNIPSVVTFESVKTGFDLMCVYSISIFDHKEGLGYLGLATVCYFVDGLFRSLGSVDIGFVSEEDWEEENID